MREGEVDSILGRAPCSVAAGRGRQRQSEAISGHQCSSVLISAHQCSSALISTHRAQARRVEVGTGGDEAISGHQWSSVLTVLRRGG
jgi:hypothetical protein